MPDRDGFPTEGMELTHILVVEDMGRALGFYKDVLGATVFREYGGNSIVLQFQGSWLLLVTGEVPPRTSRTSVLRHRRMSDR